ncbi:MAG: cytochrome c nitrite reductase small subunit [Acidobacteria bacterium]|nr:cytochrome c nitrite reductase small subunit [Acidobacteriota bacterium]
MGQRGQSKSLISRERHGSAAWLFLGSLCGIFLGVGVFTFGYAKGAAYLTDNPAACANCHVMREQQAGWMKSSHRQAAVCNDCHAPEGFVPKYATKALNGFFHSWAFTTDRFPGQIRITARNRGVTENACLKCHAEITAGLRAARHPAERVSCISCHASVGHEQ